MTDIKEQTRLLREVRLALQNNDFPVAIHSLHQAIKLAHENGDRGMEGRHLGNLALIYYRLGRPEEALHHFELALDCAREEGDRLTEDGLLGNMGNIMRELRRYDDAKRYLNQALLIAQEIGDVRGRGIWLGNLGLVYDDMNQPQQALTLHQQSVDIARELYDMRGLAARLGNLGNSRISLGEFDRALEHFKESVALFEQLGDRKGLALRLGVIGNVYTEMGRRLLPDPAAKEHFYTALQYYQQTLALAQELEDRPGEAEVLHIIGSVLGELGHYQHAVSYLGTAYDMFRAMGLMEQALQTRQNLDLARLHAGES